MSGTGEQIGATQQQQKKKSESFKRAIGKHAIKPARGNIKLWTKKIILVLFYIYYWLLPPPLLLLSTHHSRIHSPDEARVVGGHAAATNLWNVPFYNKRAWHWQTTRSEESRLINPTPANEKNPTSNNKSTRAPPPPKTTSVSILINGQKSGIKKNGPWIYLCTRWVGGLFLLNWPW